MVANGTDTSAAATASTAESSGTPSASAAAVASPKNGTAESMPSWTTTSTSEAPLISLEERLRFRKTIPHLASMNIADFDSVMDQAKLLTFDAGSVIMREGKPGRTFYIIKEGQVEICQKTFAEDPLQASGWYLGTVVNRLVTGDFFGERSLLTGEPRAASIRAVETTSCYAIDRDVFPLSCPLSGRTRFTTSTNDWMDQVDEKYGVNFADLYEREVVNQIQAANAASQTRGSVNKPNKIPGVDTEEDEDIDWEAMAAATAANQDAGTTSPTTTTTTTSTGEASLPSAASTAIPQLTTNNETIFNVLRRFKMIRQVSKCFEYIALTGARWGETGSRTRRAMLVSRLSQADREEFSETFDLIDLDRSGEITLLELKRVMQSVGDTKTDEELVELISESVRPSSSSSSTKTVSSKDAADSETLPGMNKEDFLGIMAEAEFYNLFRDIFRTLDPHDSGYVKARDLDRVLSGTRDLISDDRKSIIDIGSEDDEDLDMLIDYEQFSRMLLG